MSASRRRIYVAIGNRRDLSHRGGDVLNETKLYRRISTFADVYYNGQLIDWDAPGFGLDPDRPLGIPDDDFDLDTSRTTRTVAHRATRRSSPPIPTTSASGRPPRVCS